MEINLLDIYYKTFGFVGRPYGNGADEVTVARKEDFSNSTHATLETEVTSMLGTPIMMPMKLNGKLLPLEPLVTVNLKKRIIETEIDGARGSFKEGFTEGDYNVTIQGIIIDEDNYEDDIYPEEKVRELREIVEQRHRLTQDKNSKRSDYIKVGSIAVVHKVLNMFGIYDIVIYEATWPQVPGEISMQGYTLVCKSDVTRSLKLNKS